MKRNLLTTIAALMGLLLPLTITATPAMAGDPHFIDSAFRLNVNGTTLTVSGKEAGLGDETQIHVMFSATASCINPGGNHPKAANKTSVSAADTFPVQNGKADFTLSATAVFQPSCDPPMTVVFTNIVVTDLDNGLVFRF